MNPGLIVEEVNSMNPGLIPEGTKMNKTTPRYRVVDGVLVWIRRDITDFTVPDGVISVPGEVIHENIRRLVFADSVESFYIPEFNSIEEIIFPKKIVAYRDRKDHNSRFDYEDVDLGLSNLTKVKRVGIPYSHRVRKVRGTVGDVWDDEREATYEGNYKCEKIIIRYDSFKQLEVYTYGDKKEYIRHHFHDGLKIKRIECIGPELTALEKREIEKKFESLGRMVVVTYSRPKDVSEEEEYDDDEMQVLVDEIKKLASFLPEKTQKHILDQINILINEYYVKIEKLEPRYSRKKEPFVPSLETPLSLKANLLDNLRKIKFGLSSEEVLIKLLSDIERYKKITKMDISEFTDDNTLEADIMNIVFLSNSLDDNRKAYILNKLVGILDDIAAGITKQIPTINNSKELVLALPKDYQGELTKSIIDLLNETKNIYEQVGPYKKLFDCLSGKNTMVDNNDKTIVYDINLIRNVLSRLSDGEGKNEIEKEFNKLLKKYREIVLNILNGNDLLNKSDYEKLELDFRKELHPLLEEINRHAQLDKYESTTANKVNIQNQLIESLKLIKSDKAIKISNKKRKKEPPIPVITSFVIDIFNEVMLNNEITSDTKRLIIDDLEFTLNTAFNGLKKRTISSLSEYNEVISEILNNLAEIKINMLEYIFNMRNYDIQSR